MKKFCAIALFLCLTVFLSGCLFEGVAFFYSDYVELDGFEICINKVANCCFVSHYDCTEYTENLEITIPDDYNGIPIKRIGGASGSGFPAPFGISLFDLYVNAPEGSEYYGTFTRDAVECETSENYTVEDVVFTLNIGKNIEVIEWVNMDAYYPHINDDGSITFYHAVVNLTCSDENKYFYSKDGKLYDKKTNELISDFAYPVN